MPDLLETRQNVSTGTESSVGELREDALLRLKKKREFLQHLFVYALVNGALWTAWIAVGLVDGFGFVFPIFPTVFWGIGLLAHAWDAYRPPGHSETRVHREMERLRG